MTKNIETNENTLPQEHEKTETCITCPYIASYFIDKDKNNINEDCMSSYFCLMTQIKNMKNKFSPKQIYLIVPRFERRENNFVLPQFVINTYDGIRNHYQAKIKKSVYDKLLLLLAKCTLSNTLLPMAIAIRNKTIGISITNYNQYCMFREVFISNGEYDYESIETSDDITTLDENMLMNDLLQNTSLVATSQN